MLLQYALFSSITTAMACYTAQRATNSFNGFLLYLFSAPLHMLVILNFCGFLLFLFAKSVQAFFLGPLRETEIKKTQERLLNFTVFKIMFIAAMLEHHLGQLLMWVGWFSVVAFLKLFSLLCRDRFDYLCNAHELRSNSVHTRPFVLLVLVFVGNIAFAVLGWRSSQDSAQALLLCFECFNTLVESTHTLCKYAIFALDARRYGGNWDERGHWLYYLEFGSDSLILVATFLHYMHLLYTLGVSFTLIDVVLLLNMRTVVLSLQRKFAAYRTFVAMERELRDKYPSLSGADLPAEEVCAICRDTMTVAKQLPCGHLYHLGCIRSWLEQNQHNCPMCRHDLRKAVAPNGGVDARAAVQNDNNAEAVVAPAAAAGVGAGGLFGGWFGGGGGRPHAETRAEDVDRVAEMFPHLTRELIAAELLRSGSVETAIDNIVEGRVAHAMPPPMPPARAASPPVQQPRARLPQQLPARVASLPPQTPATRVAEPPAVSSASLHTTPEPPELRASPATAATLLERRQLLLNAALRRRAPADDRVDE